MEIIKPENMSYVEFKSKQYPGYEIRRMKEISKQLSKLKAAMEKDKGFLESEIKKHGPLSEEAVVAQGLYDKSLDAYETLKSDLDSEAVFTDQSVEYRPYIPAEPDFSIGDYVGRQSIEANRVKLVIDHYNDTDIVQEVPEGKPIKDRPLTNYLSVLDTDAAESIYFDDILSIGYAAYDDDKAVINAAFDAAHARHFINAENKKALDILVKSKEAVTVTTENIQTAINGRLCGKAKRNTIIIVNKNGFAELDVDINGVSQVTKDPAGNMVYKNKYIIREVPEVILPDTEAGTPCVIGDIKNVLKFFMIRDDALFKDDVYPYNVADRRVKKEIITTTTTSDEAYFIGTLAKQS